MCYLKLASVYLLLYFTNSCLSADVRAISPCTNLLLESPHWSIQENVLYYVDFFGQKVFRYDPINKQMANRSIDYGITGFVVPVKGYPKTLVVSVRNGLYIVNWHSPPGDSSLRMLSVVDVGKPNNNINDGKADAEGNLWFGTFGKIFNIYPVTTAETDKGSLYTINQYNHVHPEIKIRPVSISNGITWSLDNEKMFYIDSLTKTVASYDFILERSEIGNKTILFKFEENGVPGLPDGMTIDADGNLWVATFQGGEVIQIDSKTGKLLQRVKIPADIVSSVGWGGEDLSTLYVTTGQVSVKSPMPLSGCLFEVTGLGTKGTPQYEFVFPNANKY